MPDTLYDTNTSTGLRRGYGPVGGVAAGFAQRFGIDANIVRLGMAAAGLVLGPIVAFAYLMAWMIVPVDERLPYDRRPGSVPRVLLGVVAAIIAIQLVVGVVTNLPISWILLGGIAIYWFFIKD